MSEIEISTICPVGQHARDLSASHRAIASVLAGTGRGAEFIYVLDGPRPDLAEELLHLRDDRFPVSVLQMARGFGEATALHIGFERALGRYVLTIADRPQITPTIIHDILERLDRGDQAVVTRRHPRTDAWFNRLQSAVFHALVRRFARQEFHDMTCGVRGFTREAARRLDLYGDQHRFIPVIASRCGYRVVELAGAQHPDNRKLRLRGPGVYARRFLDILNIYFLSRFTRKPLRFFGLIGMFLGAVGFAISAYLAVERLLGLAALADRPLLLLGVLLIVLGVQVTAIGLLGEIIIFFLSAKRETPEVDELRFETSAAEHSRHGGAAGGGA